LVFRIQTKGSLTIEKEKTMISQQAPCLFRYGLYQFGESIFKNGRVTPYTVRLPQSPQKQLFQSLAESAWSLGQMNGLQKVDCIGIANSGIPLAQAIHEHSSSLGKLTRCLIVYPRVSVQILISAESGVTPILIDNAVTTGETVSKALSTVRRFGHEPQVILRVFDREDVGEDGLSAAERIRTCLGLDLVSIFRLRDIIPWLDKRECQAVLLYQATHGTVSFKEWIGGQHVL
jgi:orotate phosphoribosyltransferase